MHIKSLYPYSTKLYIPAQFRIYNDLKIKIQFYYDNIEELQKSKLLYRNSSDYYVIERIIPENLYKLLKSLYYSLTSYYKSSTELYHYCQFRIDDSQQIIHIQVPITNSDLKYMHFEDYKNLINSIFYREFPEYNIKYLAFNLPIKDYV